MCLTDIENRVLAIMGVQAATGMPIPEVGFGMAEDTVEVLQIVSYKPTEPENFTFTTPTLIDDDADWKIPGCSKDTVPVPSILRSCTPPRSSTHNKPITPPKSTTPPKSPTVPQRPNTPQPAPRKRKNSKTIEGYFVMSEMNAREDNRERERLFVELERERIRQRDIELQLQAQWLEFMKEALNMLGKYFSNKK